MNVLCLYQSIIVHLIREERADIVMMTSTCVPRWASDQFSTLISSRETNLGRPLSTSTLTKRDHSVVSSNLHVQSQRLLVILVLILLLLATQRSRERNKLTNFISFLSVLLFCSVCFSSFISFIIICLLFSSRHPSTRC